MISKNNSSEQIHFIGICGTAMGSVAAALQNRGYIVTGSDQNVYPPMSDFLIENGSQNASDASSEGDQKWSPRT